VVAKFVGRELKALSGLRRMETWKGLRMISDKASVCKRSDFVFDF